LDVEVELVPITTTGDRRQEPIGPGSGTGLFTKELQRALLDERIDLAVHSLKDLPTDEVSGLWLATVPQRASSGDVLVATEYGSLDELPEGAVIGTGSLRRRAQLLHVRADLRMEDIRGNVDTRLRKLAQGDYDALVLAEAGLRRLGLDEHITQPLPTQIMLPAVGQGALGLETRSDDHRTREAVEPLDHVASHAAVLAERAMLARLRGGCLAPVGALGRLVQEDTLELHGRVLCPDGSEKIESRRMGPPSDAVTLGQQLADELMAEGAADLIQRARYDAPPEANT
jgi:hydroxymethylbilane synthase